MALQAKEKYNQAKVDKLAEYVRLYHEKGRPIDYEILVDGFKAVRRTNDPEMFNIFEDFVSADTRSVEILFYIGNSNNNDKHIFFFGESPKEELGSVDIDSRVDEKYQMKVKEGEFDQLKIDYKQLESDYEELEKQVAQLEKEKQEMINNQSPLKGVLGEIGSSLVESFIRRNPSLMKSIPGGEALSGLIENDSKKAEEQQREHSGEEEVTFQPKTASTPVMTEEEQMAITFVHQLKTKFTRDEFDKILVILEELSNNKSKIEAVFKDICVKG